MSHSYHSNPAGRAYGSTCTSATVLVSNAPWSVMISSAVHNGEIDGTEKYVRVEFGTLKQKDEAKKESDVQLIVQR